MISKTRYMMKMILVIILILATPAVFFGSIGDHPFQVRENATRTIAVVNEDIKAEKENKAIDFGTQIMTILEEDSNYQWVAMSRSAAVNGLKNTKYDAVVYIPSDFSSNIMTYEDKQPDKAKFEYDVQEQLNVVNREKVLREMERATNRVNGKISTLYWMYISQDLEGVRGHFDEIVQKEIDFQKAMLAFYSPSSKSLAGEIEQQKNMLESIQTATKSLDKAAPNRIDNINQFEQNLTAFVEFVEKYKEYQEAQQQILQQLQEESLGTIEAFASNQIPTLTDSINSFNQQGGQLSLELEEMGKQLEENSENVNNLSAIRLDQIDRQKEELIAYFRERETESLNQAVNKLQTLKSELTNGPQQPDNQGAADTAQTPTEQSSAGTVNTEKEREELQSIAKELNDIKTNLEAIAEPQPEQVTATINSIPLLAERMSKVEQQLAAMDAEENPLQPIVDELNAKIKDLLDNANSQVDQMDELIEEIKKKEQAVLASPVLTQEKKDVLSTVFSKEIEGGSSNAILNYYAGLVQLETLLQDSLNASNENLQAVQERISPILGINEQEQTMWNELSTDMPSATGQITTLQEQLNTFLAGYSEEVEEQHSTIMEDLSSLEDSSEQIMNHVQFISADAPASTEEVDGQSVVTHQKGLAQEMAMIHDLVNSLGDSQDQIVTYTDDLQSKVENVQQDANTLNNKWAANVDTTKMFRDDIFNVLGNAYVDGQKNGPVYDHLAQPLQISGDSTSKKEEKNIPPVIILVIVLIASLLIGYFSHYFKGAPKLVQVAVFALLNLIVGLIISIYGLNIYPLEEVRAIEWTIMTVLLLTAVSTIVLVSFTFGNLLGWLVSVALVVFFVSPLLALIAPNIDYEDPMSKVYMSIQYEPESLFIPAVTVLMGIIVVLTVIPLAIQIWKNKRARSIEEEESYEA
ncbi:type VII secretion protein EsaA [Bacillus sp. JJ634]